MCSKDNKINAFFRGAVLDVYTVLHYHFSRFALAGRLIVESPFTTRLTLSAGDVMLQNPFFWKYRANKVAPLSVVLFFSAIFAASRGLAQSSIKGGLFNLPTKIKKDVNVAIGKDNTANQTSIKLQKAGVRGGFSVPWDPTQKHIMGLWVYVTQKLKEAIQGNVGGGPLNGAIGSAAEANMWGAINHGEPGGAATKVTGGALNLVLGGAMANSGAVVVRGGKL